MVTTVPFEGCNMTRSDRVRGAVYGLLVGDALGVPYEFNAPEAIPAFEAIEMEPPVGFTRAHAGVPPGTWSDDGAQALCLLASLLERGRLDPDDFGPRMLRWLDDGYMAVDGRVFDVGITTSRSLGAIRLGVPPAQAGQKGQDSNGNGALMRVLPLALWHRGNDAELARDAQLQSVITHGHLRSQVCCALYCLWARRMLEEEEDAWGSAVSTLRELYREEPAAEEELEWSVRPDDPPSGSGGGYVVDCLRSARLALLKPTYEQVVRVAIRLGDDTDTTACVAGGLAGLRDGVEGIPLRWRSALRGQELVQPLLEGLLGRL
jgi:ADP-ribosyl-[dinitrogen reductase] hydrolase